MNDTVYDNLSLSRFGIEVDGHTAFTKYTISPGVITFIHTEVPKELAGKGVGSRLAQGALEAVRARGLKVVAECPFIAAYITKHPEYQTLLTETRHG